MNRLKDFKGNLVYQPLKRPHHRGNPIQDPFTLPGVRRRGQRKRDARWREFYPIDIHEIRRSFGQTRGQFAEMMGISKETLRNWERGRRYPQGPARALLRIARADPDVVAAVLVRNKVTWGRDDPADGF